LNFPKKVPKEPDFCSEGVRILTVSQEGESPLTHQTKHMRTRQGRLCSFRTSLPHKLLRVLRPLGVVALLAASAVPTLHAQTNTQVLCQPQVIGNRRIPKESVLARLFSRQGDLYDATVVERDFNSLWNTGYFEDIRMEREDTDKCVQLVIYVREKPTIAAIDYKGLNAVTQSDVLERFKKEKVGLSVESQYDPTRIKRAEVVLKEMLAEHGHQFATIQTEVKTRPPSSVNVQFVVKEGPTVKVGKIVFEGNPSLKARTLRASMKNLKPIGIPHSIVFENLFARTFDSTKLDEDSERVRQAYRDRGYFKALVGEPQTHVRDAGGLDLLLRPSKGKRVDILMPIEEGGRYRLGGLTFTGNKAVTNTRVLRAQFAQKDGEWFNATMFGKGLEQLRKAYGELGYINFVANPTPRVDEAKHLVYLDIDITEGKPYYVSRIEFSGNTVTRDKVIRRELLLEEGQVYNNRLWEMSILRLNQLNYFETLKAEEDSETRQNEQEGSVDLLLKLKEKGKNSIGLNGGISGLSGTFIGLNYETNNFLGLGETLSVQANVGDLSRNLSLGFTEPYFRNRPLSLGVQVFTSKYDYNPAKSYGINNNSGTALSAQQSSLITNYNQSTTGLSVSTSYPLRRSLKRVGVSYQLSRSTVTTFNDTTRNVFQTLAFRSQTIAGQNALNGIITSVITPSFSYSSIGHPSRPRDGKEFSAAIQVAGAGGNVKYYSPVISYRQFFPMKWLRVNRDGRNVLGYRIQFAHAAGFGGEVTPPMNRLYSGGEGELRGFDVRSASPYVWIPNKILFPLTNPDGSTVPKYPSDPSQGPIQMPLPVFRIVPIGGDTSLTTNIEYRIPIAGPVTFAFFDDFGLDVDLRQSQLRESVLGNDAVTSGLYGCSSYSLVNGACSSNVHGADIPAFTPRNLTAVNGTNWVPRMSTGAELQVILPIVNAPFRLYYAYNPLRLYEQIPQQLALSNPDFQNLFPRSDPKCTPTTAAPCALTGAGAYSYQYALQLYGAQYQLREPRKTFRLTVSTTF
jgi:outer membrane protein insertion porin family